MKVNKKCVQSMCMGLFGLLILLGSCDKQQDLLTEEYPALYEAVLARDASAILTFTDHTIKEVREQAWRAMYSTPVNESELEELIGAASSSSSYLPWFALSSKELDSLQLRRVEAAWDQRPDARPGIAEVLGQQGDEQSMEFLYSNSEDIVGGIHELQYALAVGRLSLRYEPDEELEIWLSERSAAQKDELTGAAYLFSWYRSGRVLKTDAAQGIIKSLSDDDAHPMVRQYALKILLNDAAADIPLVINGRDLSQADVQEAVIIAAAMTSRDIGEIPREVVNELLEHSNPLVNQYVLDILSKKDLTATELESVITERIIENEDKEYAVRLAGIGALTDPAPFTEQAMEWAAKDEYLTSRLLDILRKTESAGDHFRTLEKMYEQGDPLTAYFVVQSLAPWWTPLSEQEKEEVGYASLRSFAMDVLNRGDRSMSFALWTVLMDEKVIRDSDYEQIAASLEAFRLPGDVEVYQVFSSLLYTRFEEEARPLIDSLAAYGNQALNSNLLDQGWDIEHEKGPSENDFRRPDWEQLARLAEAPVWKLETTKGRIEIHLHVLSAPATLSGMKYLSDSGAYDGVAFHRVVPNFVIQGGDVETGNGMGGPDYVVPTESSEKQYLRGTVGIASAGTDTEGSQFFIMHKWDPRLNGSYTIIGEVTAGMDVVDRIVVGDRVLTSTMGGN